MVIPTDRHITNIVVNVQGQDMLCDLSNAAGWLDVSSNIGIQISEKSCSVVDFDSPPAQPNDIFLQQCRYMTDQKGNSALFCNN